MPTAVRAVAARAKKRILGQGIRGIGSDREDERADRQGHEQGMDGMPAERGDARDGVVLVAAAGMGTVPRAQGGRVR